MQVSQSIPQLASPLPHDETTLERHAAHPVHQDNTLAYQMVTDPVQR